MKHPRLYDDLAPLWASLSPPEDYAAEAGHLVDVLREQLGDGPWTMLELGGGGGHTLFHLKRFGPCTAVDLSEPMLQACRRLNPDIVTATGDMRDARLSQTFDAVLLHDAADYLTTLDDVRAACRTCADHLRPGGVALIAPTTTQETFVQGDSAHDQAQTDDAEVTFLTYVHSPNPNESAMEMVFVLLLREHATGQVQVIEDRHALGLFAQDQWMQAMREAGLDVSAAPMLDDEGAPAWTVFVGRKPEP